jgi:hypothetical protein
MQGRKAAGGTAIRCGIELKVRGSIVIAIMIDGDLQEVSSGLTAQERRTPVVADAAGVPKVVTPVLDETRTDLAPIKAGDAYNAHLRIARRDLTISCPHVVGGEDEGGGAVAVRPHAEAHFCFLPCTTPCRWIGRHAMLAPEPY